MNSVGVAAKQEIKASAVAEAGFAAASRAYEELPEWQPMLQHGEKMVTARLSREARQSLIQATTPRLTKFVPHEPFAQQAAFLLLDCREALYGGAAGGGKSDALLMAALQYVDIPGYTAILFRKSYADLSLPGALMDRAAEWLQPWIKTGEVKWIDKLKTYVFFCPEGGTSTLSFGYLELEKDKFRYQGAEFQFIGFDELTQMSETNYRYMFSRLRRLKGVEIPLRMRGASNPGGEGHEWVKTRFIVCGKQAGRVFIPSKAKDNPHLDLDEYLASLDELDDVTKAQLKDGDWDVKHEGSMFDRSWFKIIEPSQVPKGIRKCRFWDMAATEEHLVRNNKVNDPDWTVGTLLGEKDGIYYVIDVRRFRKEPDQTEKYIAHQAAVDGPISIFMEQEPGSSGKIAIDHYSRVVLKGKNFQGVRSTGSKMLRAMPASTAASKGHIYVVRGDWNTAWFDELEAFGVIKGHDDQVDSFSGAFTMVKKAVRPGIKITEFGTGGESYWESA